MIVYKNIGKEIMARRKKLKIKTKDINSKLAEVLNISPFTAKNFRDVVEGDFIYGTASLTGIRGKRGQTNLNKLSVYLKILDFDSDDEVIEEIRKIDKRFVYPPQKI